MGFLEAVFGRYYDFKTRSVDFKAINQFQAMELYFFHRDVIRSIKRRTPFHAICSLLHIQMGYDGNTCVIENIGVRPCVLDLGSLQDILGDIARHCLREELSLVIKADMFRRHAVLQIVYQMGLSVSETRIAKKNIYTGESQEFSIFAFGNDCLKLLKNKPDRCPSCSEINCQISTGPAYDYVANALMGEFGHCVSEASNFLPHELYLSGDDLTVYKEREITYLRSGGRLDLDTIVRKVLEETDGEATFICIIEPVFGRFSMHDDGYDDTTPEYIRSGRITEYSPEEMDLAFGCSLPYGIVSALCLNDTDVVLEIGSGSGLYSLVLSGCVGRWIATAPTHHADSNKTSFSSVIYTDDPFRVVDAKEITVLLFTTVPDQDSMQNTLNHFQGRTVYVSRGRNQGQYDAGKDDSVLSELYNYTYSIPLYAFEIIGKQNYYERIEKWRRKGECGW